MANIPVGDPGCTFMEVISTIENSAAAPIILSEWKKFARALGIDATTRQALQRDITLSLKENVDVIESILMKWRAQNGKRATLNKLLRQVEDACDWQDLAGMLRNMIQTKAEKWDDLDKKSKEVVLSSPVAFIGRMTSLREVGETLGMETLNPILEKYLDKSMLSGALCGTPWSMDDNKLDAQILYYIPRTLTLMRELDPKVFRIKCRDIFAFEGLRPSQLSTLVQPELTDLSGFQLEKITVRFILLEREQDFEKANDPIHRISHEHDRYFWVSTVGSVKLIRDHLVNETEERSQLEMVTQGLSVFNSRPIAIADIPGMGKSVLLSQLAREVQEEYPSRYVLIVSLPKLLSFFEGQREHPLSLSDIKQKLAKYATNSKMGQTILFELMTAATTKFEVFMDAFDEIPTSQVSLVKHLLQIIAQSNNLRGIVATRTYVRDDLEQSIGVISWNIKPFTEEDQINFFIRYWTTTLQLESAERVAHFARDFVQFFRSSGFISDDNEKDYFAGVPLLCYMLAFVYSDEAQRFCSGTIIEFGIPYKIRNLHEMYKIFINIRLKGIEEVEMSEIKEALWKAAVSLIFPHWVDNLEKSGLLGSCELSNNSEDSRRLLSFGILKNVNPITFVHRTFAEFLVADFVVSKLKNKGSGGNCKVLLDFLFDGVLSSGETVNSVGVINQNVSYTIFDEFVAVLRKSSVWPRIHGELEKLKNVLRVDEPYVVDYSCENSLVRLLILWSDLNGKAGSYERLVKLLRQGMKWPEELFDALLQIPSILTVGYQHPLVCQFLDDLLNTNDDNQHFANLSTELHEMTPGFFQSSEWTTGSAGQFFQHSSMCVSRGFANLFYFLKSIYVPLLDWEDLRGHPWTSVVVSAARQDLSLFKTVSQFVEGVYGVSIFHLDYELSRTGMSYTPLHEAVTVGNYQVVEFILHKYNPSTFSKMTDLLFVAASYSTKNPLSVVKRKLEIIRYLIKNSICNPLTDTASLTYLKGNQNHFAMVGVVWPHVKLLKFFIDFGVDLEHFMYKLDFVHSTLANYTADEVDELVDFLSEKKLLKLLFLKVNSSSALQLLSFVGNLRPKSFQKVFASDEFSLDDMGDTFDTFYVIVSSRWQPEMTKAFVERFDCVNLREKEDNYSLLMMAAKITSLPSIKYLVSAGAKVNVFSDSGMSPLACVLSFAPIVDSSLIHECVKFLLESGADVNAQNVRGITLLDMFDELNVGKVIQRRTIDLLIEKSDRQKYTFSEGKFLKNENKRNKCVVM